MNWLITAVIGVAAFAQFQNATRLVEVLTMIGALRSPRYSPLFRRVGRHSPDKPRHQTGDFR